MLIDKNTFLKKISDTKVIDEMLQEEGEVIDLPYREYKMNEDEIVEYLFGTESYVTDKASVMIWESAMNEIGDEIYLNHMEFLARKGLEAGLVGAESLEKAFRDYGSPLEYIREVYPDLYIRLEDKVRDSVAVNDYPLLEIESFTPWTLAFNPIDPSVAIDNAAEFDYVPKDARSQGKVMGLEDCYISFKELEFESGDLAPVGSGVVRSMAEKKFWKNGESKFYTYKQEGKRDIKAEASLVSLLGVAESYLGKEAKSLSKKKVEEALLDPKEREAFLMRSMQGKYLKDDAFDPYGEMTEYGIEVKRGMELVLDLYEKVREKGATSSLSDFLSNHSVSALYGNGDLRNYVRTFARLVGEDPETVIYEIEKSTDSALYKEDDPASHLSDISAKINESLLNAGGRLDSLVVVVPSHSLGIDQARELNEISYRATYRTAEDGKKVNSAKTIRIPKGTSVFPCCALQGAGGLEIETVSDVEMLVGGEKGAAPIVQPINVPIGGLRVEPVDEIFGLGYQLFEEGSTLQVSESLPAEEILALESKNETEMQIDIVKKRMREAVSLDGEKGERAFRVIDKMVETAKKSGMKAFFSDLAYDAENLNLTMRNGATKMVWAVRDSGTWGMSVDDPQYLYDHKLTHTVRLKEGQGGDISPLAIPAYNITRTLSPEGEVNEKIGNQKIYLIDLDREDTPFVEIDGKEVWDIVRSQSEAIGRIWGRVKESEVAKKNPDFSPSLDRLFRDLKGESSTTILRKDRLVNDLISQHKMLSPYELRSCASVVTNTAEEIMSKHGFGAEEKRSRDEELAAGAKEKEEAGLKAKELNSEPGSKVGPSL